MSDILLLARAFRYAAVQHAGQTRKGADAQPYVNHVAEVAARVADATGGRDAALVAAALLHDTIEDTGSTEAELRALFGDDVTALVLEVTDDKTLPKAVRKEAQVAHAPHLSARAKLLKLADKMSNLREIAENPPADWPVERMHAYADWAGRVVAGLRGTDAGLEDAVDGMIARVRAI